MSFNKMEAFKKIDEILSEVRIACNQAEIPFIWVAAVADSEEDGTTYMAAIDENKTAHKGKKAKKYMCNTLTPGSMGLDLHGDDMIRDIIKVLNGFKVVAKDEAITIDPEDFTLSNMLEGKQYEKNKEGGFVMPISNDPEDLRLEEKAESTPIILLDKLGFMSLPRVEEDYIENVNEKESTTCP